MDKKREQETACAVPLGRKLSYTCRDQLFHIADLESLLVPAPFSGTRELRVKLLDNTKYLSLWWISENHYGASVHVTSIYILFNSHEGRQDRN